MTRGLLLPTLVLCFAVIGEPQAQQQAKNGRWNETKAVHGLPFCALTLREFFDREAHERTVYVLMEPAQVNEGNLRLLFESISRRFPNDPTLKVWVETDVEQLASLATGEMVTLSPGFGANAAAPESASERVLQMASYKRTESVELFIYNTNPPKAGEKTIIIRGKED